VEQIKDKIMWKSWAGRELVGKIKDKTMWKSLVRKGNGRKN